MQMELTESYRHQVRTGNLQADPGQLSALEALQQLNREISGRERTRSFFGFRRYRPRIHGLYLWGGVGRGKTMLMDMFHSRSTASTKKRWHFLEFMQIVHGLLGEVRRTGVSDAIPPVAERIAAEASLLCLDECQINDIADAMVVGRLFGHLLDVGSTVCTTSNRPPRDLYKNGINRHLFVPFIELIEDRMLVHEMGTGTDHRREQMVGERVYFTPLGPEATGAIDRMWNRLVGSRSSSLRIPVLGREVSLNRYRDGVARTTFRHLCGHDHGPADFLAIASSVRVLIVEDIPYLSRSSYNEAKRFVMLVDALYEAEVRLIVSAADVPEFLYVEGEGAFEFARTASRLHEMQGAAWGERRVSEQTELPEP